MSLETSKTVFLRHGSGATGNHDPKEVTSGVFKGSGAVSALVFTLESLGSGVGSGVTGSR